MLDTTEERLGAAYELLMVEQHGVVAAPGEIQTLMVAQPHAIQEGFQVLPLSFEETTVSIDVDISLHAGSRLAGIYELLEQCLLELPNKDILLAHSVNKQFNAIINSSPRLQEKLFFTSRLAFGDAFKAKLNPLIMREGTLDAIPLFFDNEKKCLAYCYQDGYRRLYCRSITATTVWVYLEFSDEPCGKSGERRCQTATLEKGSWERMYLAQPSYFFSWRVQLSHLPEQHKAGENVQGTYSGIVKGAKTMGSLLDGLVDSSRPVDR